MQTAEALAETMLASLPKGKFERRENHISLQHRSLIKKKPIEQVHFAIGYPALPREHALSDALQTMNSVWGGSMSSRLFQEVREKMGLAYSVYSYVSAFSECGSLIIYAGVNPASADKAYEAIGKGDYGRRISPRKGTDEGGYAFFTGKHFLSDAPLRKIYAFQRYAFRL